MQVLTAVLLQIQNSYSRVLSGRAFASLQWSLANDGWALVVVLHISPCPAVRVQHLTQLSRLTCEAARSMDPSARKVAR